MSRSVLAAVAVVVVAVSSASAHVTLERRQAPVGSYYKAVFAVPHGCAGSPTVKVRVQVPEGVIGIKPMPKAGWTVETVKGKYATEYEFHGAKISEGIKEVVWSGGKLAYQSLNYVAYAVLFFLGRRFKPSSSFLGLLGGGVLGALLFYLITNTASWLLNPFNNPEYTKTLAGWLIALTKGTKIAFEPGGYHVMAFELAPEVRPGSKVEVTLTVSGGDKYSFEAEVRAAGDER